MAEKDILCKLKSQIELSDGELVELLNTDVFDEELFCIADKKRREIYGDKVYARGLIEFTNICKNDCYYCGIRCSNKKVTRYRMKPEDIICACEKGFEYGLRTFVLQGGEDPYYTDEIMCGIVSDIRRRFPQCAITLSIGERNKDSYKALFEAGANRYLLRHETASDLHYRKLHPESMKLSERKQCLYDLKEIGYQVGSGFMVGSPFQNIENIVEDINFLKELDPDMIGIGPFISQSDTPFKEYENGSLSLTLRIIAILRILFPHALIPATTALGTIHSRGRELGLKAGANVVMPNITPEEAKKNYLLYDSKICLNEELSQCIPCLERRVNSIGYRMVSDIGNVIRDY